MTILSIVIPCYNAEQTIAETIESALAHGETDIEIIVIDDGSSDGSLDIVKTFERQVRVLSGSNQGVSAARNQGIAETSGQWIVFLDADDRLERRTIQARLATAAETNADVVICDWREIANVDDQQSKLDETKSIDWIAIKKDAEVACATHVWATTGAIMYRRGLVERIGGFRTDLPIIQDARFLFDAAYHGAKFAHSAHVGAQYRVSNDSLSKRNKSQFARDCLLNGTQIENLWRHRGDLSEKQTQALSGIYDYSARCLIAAADASYFDAVAAQEALGGRASLHMRITAPLARALGLSATRSALAFVGRLPD